MKPLLIALPSKGRLMEAAENLFNRAGFRLSRAGAARGYRGDIEGLATSR
jgi:ATP phosphoribosyltransferase